MIGVILSKVASVFILMGLGFFLNKRGILPSEMDKVLSRLLMSVTSPCLIISTMASKEIGEGLWGNVLTAMGLSVAYFAVFMGIAEIVCRRILKIPPEQDCGVYMMLFTSINNGFMGFPITLAIFGEDVLFYMVFFQVIQLLYLFGPGTVRMHYGDGEAFSKTRALRTILGPNTIAAGIGLVIMALSLKLPPFIIEPIDIIGDSTTMLSMLVIGMELGMSDFRAIARNRHLLSMSFIKMLLCPLVTLLLVNWLPVIPEIKIILTFGAAFPSAVAVAAIAANENKNSVLSAEGVAITTLMSLVTIPVMAAVISLLYL
ncbi:MAG: AEC family transporter [Clostridia bacterium]|nr:AEC family transporter [Clostridia bacterium]